MLGDPKSFPIPPKTRLRDAIRDALKGSWALVAVAVTPWAVAYAQFQSFFLSMTKDQIVARVGQTAFEEISTWLEISTWFFPLVAYLGIIAISLVCALVYRVEIAITQLNWQAKPRVGFRFHLTQVASMGLYLGLPMEAVAWVINHRSFAEPWIQLIAGSPLILIPGSIWLVGHRLYQRNRERYRRTLYGNSRRALAASLFTIAPMFGVLLAWKLSLP
nr:hypothetical protein [Stenotrophomonas geniculata]